MLVQKTVWHHKEWEVDLKHDKGSRDRVQVRHMRLLRVRAGENTDRDKHRQKLTDGYSFRTCVGF